MMKAFTSLPPLLLLLLSLLLLIAPIKALYEKEILEIFYAELGGSKWTNNENWTQEDSDVCQWYGIVCDETGYVAKLSLKNNNLRGTVPPELFDLGNLSELTLRENDIVFKFDDIDKAENLVYLDLSQTMIKKFDGLSNLNARVHTLDLSQGQIEGTLPTFLFDNLTELKQLYLDQNSITGTLSASVGNLTKLKSLDLFGNRLEGTIPDSISKLTLLRDIDISQNKFSGQFPWEALEQMPDLMGLYLHHQANNGGGFTGQLPSFKNLKNLVELMIGNNLISGTIPDQFLESIPSDRPGLIVHLDDMSLEGSVPESLQRFDDLTFRIEGNKINNIPDVLCQKSSWNNGDIGTFGCDAMACPPGYGNKMGRATSDGPCQLCQGSEGTEFYGNRYCHVSDEVRKQIDILENLYNTMGGDNWYRKENWMNEDVDFCHWEGIGCTEESLVDTINLGANNLSGNNGAFPETVFDLPSLKVLYLFSNPIGDNFNFNGIDRASNLVALNLDSTGLRSLRGLNKLKSSNNNTSIKELGFRFNQLTGGIPDVMKSLTNLEYLDMSNNHMSGSLDSNLSNLVNLHTLKLSNNSFKGKLPALDELEHITYLDLSNNKLDGTIPENFLEKTHVDSHVVVDLSNNKISGNMPESMSRFGLLDIYLRNNRISGIHKDLCSSYSEEWNGGSVEEFKCDAILCPQGSYNEYGRQTSYNTHCRKCEFAEFYGSTVCDEK